ncbi:hypothetical protein PIPA1_43460 [Pelosinus sp. IPA-1]|nr:hypothetical protein PIPA1_43460 [Pelosinus sp. IPA-1]
MRTIPASYLKNKLREMTLNYNAKKVSLQVSFYNRSDIIWKVSDKVLNEWKDVLANGPNKVSLHDTSMNKNMHAMFLVQL